MVQLHVKRGDESRFLFNTTVDAPLETVIQQITAIYNGRLKVDRICSGENDIPGDFCILCVIRCSHLLLYKAWFKVDNYLLAKHHYSKFI